MCAPEMIAALCKLILILPLINACTHLQPTPRPSMTHVDIQGVKVNYERSDLNNSGKPTLVFLHGLGASLESWNDIFPRLAAELPVVRLDLRGHGLTDKPNDDRYSLEDQALLLSSFIDTLKLQRVILVGHSYGGGVALMTYLMSKRDGRDLPVEALILIDNAGYAQRLPFFVKTIENPALQFLSNLFPATVRSRVLLNSLFYVKSQVTDERVTRYAKYFDLPGAHHAVGQAAKSLVPKNLDYWVSRYRDIDVPVLIIWGENDPVIDVSIARRLSQDIHGSKLELLEETGHVPHEERPDEVIPLILDFAKALQ